MTTSLHNMFFYH